MLMMSFFRRLFCAVAIAMATVVAGCTYKGEIRQGDIGLSEKIAELQIGMTRDEVRELFGTDITPRVFRDDEWIYYYRHRIAGFVPKVKSGGVVLAFDGDELVRIDPLPDADTPEE